MKLPLVLKTKHNYLTRHLPDGLKTGNQLGVILVQNKKNVEKTARLTFMQHILGNVFAGFSN